MDEKDGVKFLQWALPKRGYKWLGFRKPRSQVLKRIRRRMEELNISGGYSGYKSYLEENPKEWEIFDSFCYVTISKFFRDRKLWEFIRDEILCEYLFEKNCQNPVEIWSAGCCNGEETYSIAIIANQLLNEKPDAENIKILASDREEEVLRRAEQGIYPKSALKELTKSELSRYFLKMDSDDDERYRIKQELTDPIEFEKRNIRESLPLGEFDIVFCRNLVFTYFNKDPAENFLKKLKRVIKPAGYLIIGSNELLPEADWLRRVTSRHPVYKKTD